MHRVHDTQVDAFTWAYITALFWTTDEDEFPEYCYSGEFSIAKEDADRLSGDSLIRIIDDCIKFEECAEIMFAQTPAGCAQHGHDFALSRNGHGAGFFDRGYGMVGDVLQELAKSFGECHLYKGDDGKIYLS